MVGALPLLGLALALVLIEAAVQRRDGLNLADEGYLWYGSWRTANGETPMEAFRSYDPGRYYWCAPWIRVFGRGVLVLRAAVSVFLALGLWAGLMVATRTTEAWVELILVGATLLIWSHPRWKRFEHAISLIGVFVVVRVLEDPSVTNVLLAGMAAGLGAYFGRNHGVYLVVAQTGMLLYLWLGEDTTSIVALIGAWIGGGVVGYSPMWVRWLVRRGSFRFYLGEKVVAVAQRGSTNLAVPVPWPWRFARAGRNPARAVADLAHRFVLVAAPLLLLGATIWTLSRPDPTPWVLAVGLVGLPYTHHAFSRADVSHLAQALAPFWLGVSMSVTRVEPLPVAVAAWTVVVAVGLVAVGPIIPIAHRLTSATTYASTNIAGDRLRLPEAQLRLVNAITGLADTAPVGADAVFLAPDLPGMYVAIGRRSPVRNTYMVFPARDDVQLAMIDELRAADVKAAVVNDTDPSPGSAKLRFDETHPLVLRYLAGQLRAADVAGLAPDYRAFAERSPTD